MALQSWLIVCDKMYKISSEVIKFTENNMENWRVELKQEGKAYLNKNPKRDIPGRCAITTICNSDDASQSHNQKIHWSIQTSKIGAKDQPSWTTLNFLSKNRKL